MRFDGKHELWDPTSEKGVSLHMPSDLEADELELSDTIDENDRTSTS